MAKLGNRVGTGNFTSSASPKIESLFYFVEQIRNLGSRQRIRMATSISAVSPVSVGFRISGLCFLSFGFGYYFIEVNKPFLR